MNGRRTLQGSQVRRGDAYRPQALALGSGALAGRRWLGRLLYGVALLHDVHGPTRKPTRSTGARWPSSKRRGVPDHVSVGRILNDLAGLCARLKRRVDAGPLLQRSLAVLEGHWDPIARMSLTHSTGSLSSTGCKSVSARPSRSTSACPPSGEREKVPIARI